MASDARPRILVVEDEWLIAEHIEMALKAAGFDVVGPVGRIGQALDLLATEQVDAAVLDINLHGDRSFRVAEHLAGHETPFVFLSGYAKTELPMALSKRPLMQKPVDGGALGRCVEALLKRR